MLGVWAGRIIEERESNKYNRDLVEVLKEIHDNRAPDTDNQFVNIADKLTKDPIIRDAWKTLGWQIKQDAAEIFGEENYFPVRRDMLDNAIGYRSVSLTDSWTGISRLPDKAQKAMRDTFTAILGKNAVKRLKQTENVVQDMVSVAKTTIVVRSIIVARDNLTSNVGHMLLYGIDPITMARGMRDKFIEVNQYVKNSDRIQKLVADFASDRHNDVRNQRIQAEIRALEDENKSMSIWPLIQSGEFSTISESLTEADLEIREGRFSEYIDKAVNKLPGWAQTAGKNLVITKDTALFRGLNRMVQYGDFVSKAVLYDHLTETKGRPKQEVLDTLSEEFVNYNQLPGRGRDFLESMGLLWFYNYKLRITKIALKMARENPVTTLLFAGGIAPAFDIDTVMSANLPMTVVDGSWDYAVGPAMGINAGTLHPWYALTH